VPAAMAVITGITILFVSDDCPYGQYSDLKKHGTMPEVSAATSFRSGAQNLNTWILFAHYAACFGVELTMYNASALYFIDRYGLSTSSAAAVASIYGWMLLFTRATGGILSDRANARFGMRGRLWVHTLALLGEGVAILVFAHMQTLATTIVVMVFFSIFCQAASGTTFAIVPYVDPPSTGSIAGIVGAGGSVGGVAFGLVFRQLAPDATSAFVIMGIVVLVSPLLSLVVRIKGHAGLVVTGGKDRTAKSSRTIQVPEADNDISVNKKEEEEETKVVAEEGTTDLDDLHQTKNESKVE
jgi:MFS transporter, NNP family, nitrate/nitrite transporter